MLINLFVTTCFTAAHAGVQNGIFSERANFFFFDQLGGTSARHKHQLARYDSLSFFIYFSKRAVFLRDCFKTPENGSQNAKTSNKSR